MKPAILFSLVCLLACNLISQTPLFTNDDPIDLTMAVDLKALMEDRLKDEPEYRNVRISLNEASTVRDIEARIKVGGNFRKKPDNCTFPPLRLKFDKEEVEGSLFTGNKKLKLVSPCVFNTHVLKEYLVYRLYQSVAPEAFQVRLANITLVDQTDTREIQSFTGFFIEDKKLVAERSGMRVAKGDRIKEDAFNREHVTRLAIFQYAIGNKDWDLVLQKNIKVLKRGDEHIAVPYDYDFTGIVAPPYVLNLMSGDINSMRSFAPMCRTEEELLAALGPFAQKCEAWQKLIKDFELLPNAEKANMVRYLKVFTRQLKKPEKLAARLAKRCNN